MNLRFWKEVLGETPDCPPLEELKAYLAGSRASLGAHVQRCPRCQSEAGLLSSFEAEPPRDRAAVNWIVNRLEERLSWGRPAVRRVSPVPRWTGAALVAAGVVLAVGAGFLYRKQSQAPSFSTSGVEYAAERSATVDTVAPGGDLPRAPRALSWRAVAGAARYQVVVMEVDRTRVWNADSEATAVSLPAEVAARCVPGKTLLWQVTAIDARGEPLASSGIERFRVAVEP